jgi:hypothetical protein
MKRTLPAIPRLMLGRAQTLIGVAPCAQAPQVLQVRTGLYRTVRRNASVREAIRVDVVRRGRP